MIRRLWKESVSKTTIPAWTCGHCGSGTLRMVADSMVVREHHSSKVARAREDWDPHDISEVFHCVAECSSCRDLAVIAGEASHSVDWDDEIRDMAFSRDFSTRAVIPAPQMLDIPKQVPETISAEVRRAFGLYWSDPSASLNRLRCAVEALCDHAGVARWGRRADDSRFLLPLHARIERLPDRFATVKNELLAVKWLGNDGAHGPDATVDDVLDALELLDFVFDRIFRHPERAIAKLSRVINRKKGSRHRRTR